MPLSSYKSRHQPISHPCDKCLLRASILALRRRWVGWRTAGISSGRPQDIQRWQNNVATGVINRIDRVVDCIGVRWVSDNGVQLVNDTSLEDAHQCTDSPLACSGQVGQIRLDLQLDGLVAGVVEGGLRGWEKGAVVGSEEVRGFVEEGVDVVDVVNPCVDAVEDLVGGWVALLDAGLGEFVVG